MAAAYSSGTSWDWSNEVPGQWTQDDIDAQIHHESWRKSSWASSPADEPSKESEEPPAAENSTEQPPRPHYKSRTCRICLEVVPPTFDMGDMTSMFASAIGSKPRVIYTSPAGEGGRMIRPCKCKGSQKYVHEECLGAWRRQDPTQNRNYWQCPTCRYKYQLQRLTWANWISGTFTQLGLTLLIFFVAIFLLGFVADPIINIYMGGSFWGLEDDTGSLFYEDEPATWLEHCIKGITSLGLLGFLQYAWASSSAPTFAIRLVSRGHQGGDGRDRLNSFAILAVILGVFSFLYAVWKGVRSWSRRTLIQAGERVMDVHGDEDDDDEE